MEKDVVQIRCLTDNERYADLINGIVFGGRQVVQRDDLREMDSRQTSSLRYAGGVLRKRLGWEQGSAWNSGLYGYPTGTEGVYK